MLLFILQCLIERKLNMTMREHEDFEAFHASISQAILDDRSVGDTRDETVRLIDNLYIFAFTKPIREYLYDARQRAQARRMIHTCHWQHCPHCGHEIRANIRRAVVELYQHDDERLYFW